MKAVQKVLSVTKKEEPLLNLLLWQHTTTSYETRKTNSDFYLNFCANKTYVTVRGAQ